MLVRILFSIFLIYTVKTEDTVPPQKVPQAAPSKQGVLNKTIPDSRRFGPYYDDQAIKPVEIYQPMVCKNSGILLKIFNVLLTFAKHDISPAERVTYIAELAKEYLKDAPNDQPHNDLNIKVEDLMHGANVNTPIGNYKDPLRDGNYKKGKDINVKTKIVFQYKLPSLDQPNCKDVFLKLNQAARDAYLQLAKYPMCQNPKNNNVNFQNIHYGIFGPDVVPQNPYHDKNKHNIFDNPKYVNPNPEIVNYGDNQLIYPDRTLLPNNEISKDNNKYKNSYSIYAPNNKTPNRITSFERHPNEANKEFSNYLEKLLHEPEIYKHESPKMPGNLHFDLDNFFKPGHSNSVNEDSFFNIERILQQQPSNKYKDVLSYIQEYFDNLKHKPNAPNANYASNFKPENPSVFSYYHGSNDLYTPTPSLNPITSLLEKIYKKPKPILAKKITESFKTPHQEKNEIYYYGLPKPGNVPGFVQIPTQNPSHFKQKPFDHGAFTIEVENPYLTKHLPNQLNFPHYWKPVRNPNKPDQNPYSQDALSIQIDNPYQQHQPNYQLNLPKLPKYIEPFQSSNKPVQNPAPQDALNIQVKNPNQSQGLLNLPQNPYKADQNLYLQDALMIQVDNPYQSQGLPNQPDFSHHLEQAQIPNKPYQMHPRPYPSDSLTMQVENQYPQMMQNFRVPVDGPNISDHKLYPGALTVLVDNPYQSKGLSNQSEPNYIPSPVQNSNEIQKYNGNYSELNYGRQYGVGHKIPDLPSFLSVPNLLKLDSSSTKGGVIELTYLLKRPNPLVYQPFYYVKYKLPYATFLYNIKNLLINKPQLQLNSEKLYRELIALSKVSETSPDLKGFKKDYISKLTINNGALVAAKMMNDNIKNFEEQFKVIQNVNTDLTAEEIRNLGLLVTKNVPSNPIPNQSGMRTNDGVKSVSGQQPFSYHSVYDTTSDQIKDMTNTFLPNRGFPAFGRQSMNYFNVVPIPPKRKQSSVMYPFFHSAKFISPFKTNSGSRARWRGWLN